MDYGQSGTGTMQPPAGQRYINPQFPSMGRTATGRPAVRQPRNLSEALGTPPNPTGSPVPQPRQGMGLPPAGAAPMPKVTPYGQGPGMLHDAGTSQFQGAGVNRGDDGRVRFVSAPATGPVTTIKMSKPPAPEMTSLERERQLNQQGGGTQLVSTGTGTMTPKPTLASAMATPKPSAPISPQLSPFFAATGQAPPKGPSTPFNNYRAKAMMNSFQDKTGMSLAGAMGLGGEMIGQNADHQLKRELLAHQQANDLAERQMQIVQPFLADPNLSIDQRATMAGAMMGGHGGVGSGLFEALKTGQSTPFPDLTAMPPQQRVTAVAEWKRANPNARPELLNQHLARQGVSPTELAASAQGVIKPGYLAEMWNEIKSPWESHEAYTRRIMDQQNAATVAGTLPRAPQWKSQAQVDNETERLRAGMVQSLQRRLKDPTLTDAQRARHQEALSQLQPTQRPPVGGTIPRQVATGY